MAYGVGGEVFRGFQGAAHELAEEQGHFMDMEAGVFDDLPPTNAALVLNGMLDRTDRLRAGYHIPGRKPDMIGDPYQNGANGSLHTNTLRAAAIAGCSIFESS
ncbi:MAG TPA: hypothetical protein VM124_03450 [Candidatus Limnocylindrales bacterium]|nr:hypothetical protein [Candidatus Limnocylindrales bacterium]